MMHVRDLGEWLICAKGDALIGSSANHPYYVGKCMHLATSTVPRLTTTVGSPYRRGARH